MNRVSLITAAVVLAVLPTNPVAAVEEAPKVLECTGVGAFVAGWIVAGEPFSRIVVEDAVRSFAASDGISYTTLCGETGPEVVCVEDSAAELAVGRAVTVQGVVSRADGAELVLDPCGVIPRH